MCRRAGSSGQLAFCRIRLRFSRRRRERDYLVLSHQILFSPLYRPASAVRENPRRRARMAGWCGASPLTRLAISRGRPRTSSSGMRRAPRFREEVRCRSMSCISRVTPSSMLPRPEWCATHWSTTRSSGCRTRFRSSRWSMDPSWEWNTRCSSCPRYSRPITRPDTSGGR